MAPNAWGGTPESTANSGTDGAPAWPVPRAPVDASPPWAPAPAGAGVPAQPAWLAAPAPPAGTVPAPPDTWPPTPAWYATGPLPPVTDATTGKRAAPWAVAAGPATSPPPPVVATPGRQGAGNLGRGLLIAAVVLCIVAAAGGVTWYLQRDADTKTTQSAPTQADGAPLPDSSAGKEGTSDGGGSSPSSTAPSSTAPSSTAPSSTSASPIPTATTEADALSELQSLRAASLSGLVLDGRWVAQVASKSVGITDPLQVAANGTHTFYAVDILAESRAALGVVSDPSRVLLLQSIDFGKRSFAPDGQAFWVTLVDEDFSSSDEVEHWCASTYPTLTAEQLANACAARTLAPPHD